MVRRTLLVLATTAVVALAVPAVPALAGGGACHDGVTTGEGDTVEMKDACFFPSTLQIDPGDAVTFVNLDVHYTHNVSANGWGYLDDMQKGDAFTATFSEEGIYPFACQYHPGMTGAIVVGDGVGPGNGVLVAADRTPAPAVAAEPTADDGGGGIGSIGGAGIGLAVGLAAGLAVGRSTRRRRAEGGA
jgi:plastocyanin